MKVFATGWSEGYDGPGRRWVVYAKGCNLRCRWCANPEGLSGDTQVLFYANRADRSEQACPYGAVSRSVSHAPPVLDRAKCTQCVKHECVSVWRHPAFTLAGEELSVDDIVAQATRSRALFGPGGGVTFGGGEATLQLPQLTGALDALRAAGVHTALETNATSPDLPQLFDRADLLICDLKCVSADRHRAWTGADNAVILDNLHQAARHKDALWVRIPLVPGLNTDPEEQGHLLAALTKLRDGRDSLRVELLPLHHNGEPKYHALGMVYPMDTQAEVTEAEVRQFSSRLVAASIEARCATQEWQYEYRG